MRRRATRYVVVGVLALWPLSACGAEGGQGGAADRPSVTASPTRTLPTPTRSAGAPEQTEPAPAPSRSPTRSPITSRPAPTVPTTRNPEPTSQPEARTSTLPVAPAVTSSAPSPSSAPAEEAGSATAEEDAGSPAAWLALAAVVVAAAIGAWLLVRARRRRSWRTRLDATVAEVVWFARELVPQLRTSGSVDQVVGGWHVAVSRVASAEDQLTVLSSSAPSDEDAARALQLRDAVRSARGRLESFSGPGGHEEWALDLDDVEALLVAALGPTPVSSPDTGPAA